MAGACCQHRASCTLRLRLSRNCTEPRERGFLTPSCGCPASRRPRSGDHKTWRGGGGAEGHQGCTWMAGGAGRERSLARACGHRPQRGQPALTGRCPGGRGPRLPQSAAASSATAAGPTAVFCRRFGRGKLSRCPTRAPGYSQRVPGQRRPRRLGSARLTGPGPHRQPGRPPGGGEAAGPPPLVGLNCRALPLAAPAGG